MGTSGNDNYCVNVSQMGVSILVDAMYDPQGSANSGQLAGWLTCVFVRLSLRLSGDHASTKLVPANGLCHSVLPRLVIKTRSYHMLSRQMSRQEPHYVLLVAEVLKG